jgi:hypothetical protein
MYRTRQSDVGTNSIQLGPVSLSSQGTGIWMSLILGLIACDMILANHRVRDRKPGAIFPIGTRPPVLDWVLGVSIGV